MKTKETKAYDQRLTCETLPNLVLELKQRGFVDEGDIYSFKQKEFFHFKQLIYQDRLLLANDGYMSKAPDVPMLVSKHTNRVEWQCFSSVYRSPAYLISRLYPSEVFRLQAFEGRDQIVDLYLRNGKECTKNGWRLPFVLKEAFSPKYRAELKQRRKAAKRNGEVCDEYC